MNDKQYYSIPFKTKNLIQKGRLEKCDIQDSIRQNLRLLLITPPLRVRQSAYYGCKIHLQQFLAENRIMEEDRRLEDNFKVTLESNIKQLIDKFETRVHLEELTVDIRYANDEYTQWKFSEGRLPTNNVIQVIVNIKGCLLYTSPSPRDRTRSRMPSSA